MDHVVFVEAASGEMEKLLAGSKILILRGATGRKIPYGRVHGGDTLYFINNNGEGRAKARAEVRSVEELGPLTPDQSAAEIDKRAAHLRLSAAQEKRFKGRRFLVIIEVAPLQTLEPFSIDKSAYGNMDDWLPVGNIDTVKA